MAEEIEIDAVGLRCPRPIVELAKAFRKSPGDSVIVIRADDPAFNSDVEAWCEATGNALVGLVKNGPVITARIRTCGKS